MLSHSTIRRRFQLGLPSVVRLVTKLENQILDLTSLQLSDNQRAVANLSAEIKRLRLTIDDKSAQLLDAHQLNHQLGLRIRELESALVSDASAVSASPTTDVPNVLLDSHNSSAPPSLDPPWNKPRRTRSLRKQSRKTVGGQSGHRGATLLAVSNPDSVITHSLDVCTNCQSVISHINPVRFHRRQVFEVREGRLSVTEHRVLLKLCPLCNTVARSRFPTDVNAPVQYGVGARSKSLYLHLYQFIPLARTAEAMRDLFACPMSPATIRRAARACAAKLVRTEQRIKNAVRDSPVIGVDETGIRINGVINSGSRRPHRHPDSFRFSSAPRQSRF